MCSLSCIIEFSLDKCKWIRVRIWIIIILWYNNNNNTMICAKQKKACLVDDVFSNLREDDNPMTKQYHQLMI